MKIKAFCWTSQSLLPAFKTIFTASKFFVSYVDKCKTHSQGHVILSLDPGSPVRHIPPLCPDGVQTHVLGF